MCEILVVRGRVLIVRERKTTKQFWIVQAFVEVFLQEPGFVDFFLFMSLIMSRRGLKFFLIFFHRLGCGA